MTTTENEEKRQFQVLEEEYWKAFDSGSIGILKSIIHPKAISMPIR